MSTSAVAGSGNVIDVGGIVNQLMQVEQRPLSALGTKIQSANVSISAMSELKAAVDATYTAASAIEDPLMLTAKTVSVDNANALKATVSDSAAAALGSVTVTTTSLAQAERVLITSAEFSATDERIAPPGDGLLKISIPAGSTLLDDADLASGFDDSIDLTNKTLEQVRDEINSHFYFEGKIKADLVNRGSGSAPWVLVLTGTTPGASADFVAVYQEEATVDTDDPSVLDAQVTRISSAAFGPTTFNAIPSQASDVSPSGNGVLLINIPIDSVLLPTATRDIGAQQKIDLNGKTLNEVIDSINASSVGSMVVASAALNLTTNNYDLVLTGRQVDADAKFFVSYDSVDAVTEASNAKAIVGGISVESQSNVFENALPGLRLELKKAGETTKVEVGDNQAEITAKVSAFASSFSALVQKIRTLTKPGSETTQPGALASNSGVLSLSSSLMSAYSQGFRLSSPGVWTQADGSAMGRTVLVEGTSYTQLTWAQLGLELSREGTLSVNSMRLSAALTGKVGEALSGGFASDLKAALNTFRGTSGTLQSVLDGMRTNVTNLRSDQEKVQARIDRLRSSYLAKYAALDAKLVQMRQTSSNVQAALSGLSA